MKMNITYQTNEQLWRIENAAASAGYEKTADCYWSQIFSNAKTGDSFTTTREEESTNDPAADLAAILNPADPAADVEKWKEKQLFKLRTVAVASALSFLSVAVEWKRSSYFGYNPTATARTDDGTFTGRASGCGYDKESAAVAEALNQSPAVLRVLYEAAEKHMENGESFKTLSSGCVSWGDVLGYGSGYAILPYFEGGVGVSCFWSILSKYGFSCRCAASGRHFDSYTAERKGA